MDNVLHICGLDYADGIEPVTQIHQHIQEKTSTLDTISKQAGLNINIKRSEIMKVNKQN